jgi:hypothetical protein
MKLKVSKKAIFLFLALIIIGLFVYFLKPVLFGENTTPIKISEEIKNDKISPLTAVTSPEAKSWHNADFIVEINDSDLGSGLINFEKGKNGCKFIIEDMGNGAVIGGFRECELAEINVPVGQGKVCSSSYQKEDTSQGKCVINTIAFDNAGNDSGWQSRIFNIDLIKPEVFQIDLSQSNFELNKNYLFKASVSDNSHIIGCWFYVNNENSEKKVEISPIPCENGQECEIKTNYIFSEEGDYYIGFICSDIAGNLSPANFQTVKITTNHPPEISSCRVLPSQGSLQTNFQLSVEATDPNNDNLSFFWDFGDEKTSTGQNPQHQYSAPGTYEPKIIVSDNKGVKSECSTAWVIVSQE